MKGVLDTKGVLLALFFGAVLLFAGGLAYLALMLVFFFLAIAVTKYEYEIKKDMGLYEHERGWENVLSNGLLPSALALASPVVGPVPFIASISSVMADKFGSELGVLDPKDPISLFDMKPVKPGTSGAMSVMGTVGSLSGAAAIGVASVFLFQLTPTQGFLVALIGLVGSIIDTVFGVFEERGLGTKGTTNFICSLAGAILAYYLII
jgi:uncharacterized protein (TIGR00297 family)